MRMHRSIYWVAAGLVVWSCCSLTSNAEYVQTGPFADSGVITSITFTNLTFVSASDYEAYKERILQSLSTAESSAVLVVGDAGFVYGQVAAIEGDSRAIDQLIDQCKTYPSFPVEIYSIETHNDDILERYDRGLTQSALNVWGRSKSVTNELASLRSAVESDAQTYNGRFATSVAATEVEPGGCQCPDYSSILGLIYNEVKLCRNYLNEVKDIVDECREIQWEIHDMLNTEIVTFVQGLKQSLGPYATDQMYFQYWLDDVVNILYNATIQAGQAFHVPRSPDSGDYELGIQWRPLFEHFVSNQLVTAGLGYPLSALGEMAQNNVPWQSVSYPAQRQLSGVLWNYLIMPYSQLFFNGDADFGGDTVPFVKAIREFYEGGAIVAVTNRLTDTGGDDPLAVYGIQFVSNNPAHPVYVAALSNAPLEVTISPVTPDGNPFELQIDISSIGGRSVDEDGNLPVVVEDYGSEAREALRNIIAGCMEELGFPTQEQQEEAEEEADEQQEDARNSARDIKDLKDSNDLDASHLRTFWNGIKRLYTVTENLGKLKPSEQPHFDFPAIYEAGSGIVAGQGVTLDEFEVRLGSDDVGLRNYYNAFRAASTCVWALLEISVTLWLIRWIFRTSVIVAAACYCVVSGDVGAVCRLLPQLGKAFVGLE